MRPVGNALELKLCKIPTIGTQSENQTLPTGNISLGSPIVFSGWALHKPIKFNLTAEIIRAKHVLRIVFINHIARAIGNIRIVFRA
ncbi:hypothetical protein [Helicobacter pylori]|uniref:hypothetical protein n=1 Tax=Helicobacter pylori TaxID=210 RepID=UPI003CC60BB5